MFFDLVGLWGEGEVWGGLLMTKSMTNASAGNHKSRLTRIPSASSSVESYVANIVKWRVVRLQTSVRTLLPSGFSIIFFSARVSQIILEEFVIFNIGE